MKKYLYLLLFIIFILSACTACEMLFNKKEKPKEEPKYTSNILWRVKVNNILGYESRLHLIDTNIYCLTDNEVFTGKGFLETT